MAITRTLRVSPREKGVRLLAFLRDNCPDAPSVKALKRSVDGKLCKINGKVETFSTHILREGDVVDIEFGGTTVRYKPVLLWEDDVLAAYDKPAGVVCEAKNFPGNLIHRLDKETSGVVLVAKENEALEMMIELFKKKEIEKEYLAIVDGVVKEKKKTIISMISARHHFQGQTLYASSQKGQEAITHLEVLATGEKSSLVLCYPKTGRTHQLRVHLKEANHPILGDYSYARVFHAPHAARRHMLHAYKVEFKHPKTGEIIRIIAPIPVDFQEGLEVLGMTHAAEPFHKEKQRHSRNPRH
jgi:23S rRNA-/tRNA-specific pseudouridylate synthase